MPRKDKDSWDADLHPIDMRLDTSFLSRRRARKFTVKFSWDHLDHSNRQQVMQRWYPFLKRKKDGKWQSGEY